MKWNPRKGLKEEVLPSYLDEILGWNPRKGLKATLSHGE